MTRRDLNVLKSSYFCYKFDIVHQKVYARVKKRDLEKKLSYLGWWLKREGSNHEIWTNGEDTEPVPRHREIKENLAKKIIQVARNNPPKKR